MRHKFSPFFNEWTHNRWLFYLILNWKPVFKEKHISDGWNRFRHWINFEAIERSVQKMDSAVNSSSKFQSFWWYNWIFVSLFRSLAQIKNTPFLLPNYRSQSALVERIYKHWWSNNRHTLQKCRLSSSLNSKKDTVTNVEMSSYF